MGVTRSVRRVSDFVHYRLTGDYRRIADGADGLVEQVAARVENSVSDPESNPFLFVL